MERTLLLRIAYDGTDFHGWQTQPGQRTVQAEIEAALRRVVRHPINLAGSGRTDAGVHAAGQTASFVSTCTIPSGRLKHALGARIAPDLSIVDVRDVRPGFDARQHAGSKLYRYRIHAARHRSVDRLTQRHTYHVWDPLDLSAMRTASRHFIGTLDFTSFVATASPVACKVRTVLRCDVERHLDEIRIDVEGTGFLYRQVRNMVGTLLSVGWGRWKPEHVAKILEDRDRNSAGPTAPAHGLCLQWVRYSPDMLTPPQTVDADEPQPSSD